MGEEIKRTWDKHLQFQALCNRWFDEHPGKKRPDLAAALEIGIGSFKQYWGGHQIPGRLLLDRMVTVLRADYSDLRAGGEDDVPSEVDQFMLRVMGSDLTKLTEKQKQNAFEAWRAIVRGYEPPS